jgi:hypothetical protein
MNSLVRTLFATATLSLAAAGVQATAAGMDQNQPKSGEQGPPATVGAMQNEVGNKATSPEDVKRQTEGKPTMAQSAKKGDSNASHPGMTNNSPGTVGAAPGTNPETTRR